VWTWDHARRIFYTLVCGCSTLRAAAIDFSLDCGRYLREIKKLAGGYLNRKPDVIRGNQLLLQPVPLGNDRASMSAI